MDFAQSRDLAEAAIKRHFLFISFCSHETNGYFTNPDEFVSQKAKEIIARKSNRAMSRRNLVSVDPQVDED